MKLLSSGDRRASLLLSISVSAFVCFQPVPIAELDGTVSGDFFTVLCVGQSFTDDQWMNVYSFSMLRHWLLTYHSVSNSNTTADTGMTSTQTRCREAHYLSCQSCTVHTKSLRASPLKASDDLLCVFHHLQQTGCSSASPSPTPTPFLMVRHVSLWTFAACACLSETETKLFGGDTIQLTALDMIMTHSHVEQLLSNKHQKF